MALKKSILLSDGQTAEYFAYAGELHHSVEERSIAFFFSLYTNAAAAAGNLEPKRPLGLRVSLTGDKYDQYMNRVKSKELSIWEAAYMAAKNEISDMSEGSKVWLADAQDV